VQPAAGDLKKDLRGLALLLPVFERAAPDDAIEALIRVAYELGWVLPDFDWAEWARTAEAQALVRDSAAIAAADTVVLAKLLTAHLRQDRFFEGHLQWAYESGQLVAIVKRAAQLLEIEAGEGRRF